jgi:outer membrane immunogenic protein
MSLRALFVVVLSGAAIMSAHAADQSVAGTSPYYPRVYYPTSVDWTGFYAGLQFGGGYSSGQWTNPFSKKSDDPTAASALGGGQFGVNWTRDSLLLGVEADFDWTDLKGSASNGGFAHSTASDWLSLVTGRLGYAINRYVVYAKGGAAFASERDKVVGPTGKMADSSGTTQYGWTVGGGIEYAINTNWSAKVEYDFADFPSRNIVVVGSLGTQPAPVNFTVQKVVGGINYRF